MTKLLLVSALSLSTIAAFYSIVGLIAIFSASAIAIAVMGGVLEVSKLVVASWLYRNWKEVPVLLKSYFTIAILILMFITSMGIFGFLSKAHMEQTTIRGDNTLQLSSLEDKITREQNNILRSEQTLGQLDDAISRYTELGAVSKGLKARSEQEEERKLLNESIDKSYVVISNLQEQKLELKKEQLGFEAEVGPIKYIAELVYNEKADQTMLEKAVRGVIILIVIVFDPLAVLMVVAANWSLKRENPLAPMPPVGRKPKKKKIDPEFEMQNYVDGYPNDKMFEEDINSPKSKREWLDPLPPKRQIKKSSKARAQVAKKKPKRKDWSKTIELSDTVNTEDDINFVQRGWANIKKTK